MEGALIRREVGTTDHKTFPANGKAARSVKASAAEKESMRACPLARGLGTAIVPNGKNAAEPLAVQPRKRQRLLWGGGNSAV